MKGDIILMAEDFYQNNFLDKVNNATFLSLIPKKSGAEQIQDFIPISLVGSIYKILAKLLANSLKCVG